MRGEYPTDCYELSPYCSAECNTVQRCSVKCRPEGYYIVARGFIQWTWC